MKYVFWGRDENHDAHNFCGSWGLVFIGFLTFFSGGSMANAVEPLVIGTPFEVMVSQRTPESVLNNILEEIFGRIGIEVEMSFLPVERADQAMFHDLVDGVLSEVKGLDKEHPYLVPVLETIVEFRCMAIFGRQVVPVTDWGGMAHYRIGIIHGWRFCTMMPISFQDVAYVNNARQLFELLGKGRIDVALYPEIPGDYRLQFLKDKGFRIRYPLGDSKKIFLYLNSRSQDLADRVTDKLRGMKADGSYELLLKKNTLLLDVEG